jgi:hypothetical protein
MNTIPSEIKIRIDVDLFEQKQINVFHNVIIKCLTKANFKHLIPVNDLDDFEKAVTMYGCDICKNHCDINNPIYTNLMIKGCDICRNCLMSALQIVKPVESISNPENIYSLKNIANL